MKRKLSEISNKKILIAPSLLAANFAKLAEEIQAAEDAGADILHLDIMDGHFVPNLTIGPPVIESLRKYSNLIFDVHLMLTNPLKFVKPFANAGADHITFHIESSDKPEEVFNEILSTGCTAGLCVKPKTPASEIAPLLNKCNMILVMTVEPGFGGQKFMHDILPKISDIRRAINERGLNIHLEVDGGIDVNTSKLVKENGANVLVAGTSVFRAPAGHADAIQKLRNSTNK